MHCPLFALQFAWLSRSPKSFRRRRNRDADFVDCLLWRPALCYLARVLDSPHVYPPLKMHVPSGPRLSPIPPYRESPNDPLPQFKALVIGINYRSRPDELKGPVNDAKDVKNALEGGT